MGIAESLIKAYRDGYLNGKYPNNEIPLEEAKLLKTVTGWIVDDSRRRDGLDTLTPMESINLNPKISKFASIVPVITNREKTYEGIRKDIQDKGLKASPEVIEVLAQSELKYVGDINRQFFNPKDKDKLGIREVNDAVSRMYEVGVRDYDGKQLKQAIELSGAKVSDAVIEHGMAHKEAIEKARMDMKRILDNQPRKPKPDSIYLEPYADNGPLPTPTGKLAEAMNKGSRTL